MENKVWNVRMNRRRLLQLSAGVAGGIAASRVVPSFGGMPVAQAAAHNTERDPYVNAVIQPEGELVNPAPYARFRVGFSNGFSGNSWRKMMLKSLELEAADHPELKELIVVDGQGDVAKQVADIESLVSQEVDAILCIPNSGSAVVPALKQATEMNIVTVPFNLPVDGTEYTAYVGVDPARKGQRNAEWLAQAVGSGGKIVALGGLPGNSYTAAGWGAAEPILKDAGLEVLAFRDAYWEEDRAKVVMSDLIAAYPQIDGIWSDGSQMTTGALKALLAANKPPIPVCGDDYNGLLRLYDENKDQYPAFKFAAISEPDWEVRIALRTALDILKGTAVPFKQMIEPLLITNESYADYYKPDLPDAVFVDTELTDDMLKEIFGVS